MEIAKTKLLQLSQHGDLLDRYGASVRVLGQRDLLSDEVLEAIEKAESMTEGNEDAVLNVCFPYTSQNEICHAIQGVVDEWSQPLPMPESAPGRRPSFSEKHIEHTLIRSRKISTATMAPHREASPSGASDDAETTTSSLTNQRLLSPSSSPTATSSATDLDVHPSVSDLDLLKPPAQPHLGRNLTPQSPSRSPSPSRDLHPTAEALLTRSRSPSPSPPSPHSNKFPDPETITSSTLTSHMYTASLPPLDLLIRTSGVDRLSDFMLWQCHENTEIVFLKCLWPEFDLWQFLPVLVEWQWRRKKIGGGEWRMADES